MNASENSQERGAVRDRIEDRTYDVVIVGGGIAGAGVARDATLRGLDALLVEANDFACGTTGASTRLIHGGLRYLEQYDFGLVFESLRERETLADLAPHLVDPLTFAIPTYDEGVLGRLKLRAGMVLYDLLSYGKTMPNHEQLSADELAAAEPGLSRDGSHGGFLYHDRQCAFVERLCVENVLDAVDRGADVLNHAPATDLRREGGRVTGVTIRDELAGTTLDVDARAVVNAAGPWADDVLQSGDERLIRPAKGVHLVVPSLTERGVTLPTTDGRVVFVVPWNGRSLVGTTDTDFAGDPADAVATPADVDYLLRELGRYFPDLDVSDVIYTYAGVRPLYDGGASGDSADVSRAHRVVEHDTRGLFSLVGAKITPYRRAAADLTDAVADHLGVDADCRTASISLPGARGSATVDAPVSGDVADHLEGLYGTRADAVLARIERDERLAEPLCPHAEDVLAQVTVAVEEEHARRLTDVVFRRCTVGWADCEGRDAVETVADHMADLLGWSADRRREELDRYEDVLDRRHAFEDRKPP